MPPTGWPVTAAAVVAETAVVAAWLRRRGWRSTAVHAVTWAAPAAVLAPLAGPGWLTPDGPAPWWGLNTLLATAPAMATVHGGSAGARQASTPAGSTHRAGGPRHRRPPPDREEPSAMTTQWLINGVFQASTLIVVAWALSRWTRDVLARALLAVLLCGAALTYVYYAAVAGAGTGWILAELAGVAVYGSLALRGLRGSPLWLAAGWALHPVWDVALHHLGPGHAFAPDAYAITCLSFDLLVAAYVAVAHRSGLVGRRGHTPADHHRPGSSSSPLVVADHGRG